jgi:hypothetical protein
MDKEFLRAKMKKVADADQSEAIIYSHLKQHFLSDPEGVVEQWQAAFKSKSPEGFSGVVDAAIHWYGVIKVRERIFNLMEDYCFFNEDGDLEIRGDEDGDI